MVSNLVEQEKIKVIAMELYRMKVLDRHKAKAAIEKMKLISRYTADIVAEALLMLEEVKDA